MSNISEATDKIMNSMSEEGKNAAYRLMALSTRKAILEKYRDEAIPDTDEESMLKDLLSEIPNAILRLKTKVHLLLSLCYLMTGLRKSMKKLINAPQLQLKNCIWTL